MRQAGGGVRAGGCWRRWWRAGRGVFFGEQTAEGLAEAVSRAEALSWDAGAIRAHAEQFGEARFREGLRAELDALMGGGR